MFVKVRRSLVLILFTCLPTACVQDPTSVGDAGRLQILLHVTGGFAGADFTVSLDGRLGHLTGVSCVSLCEFQAGEVLHVLTEGQVDYIRSLFQGAQVHALDGEDFGVQCCDQFHYDLRYRDSLGRGFVKGSSEALPVDLRGAIAVVQGMVSGTTPVITALSSSREPWVGDPYQIREAAVAGDILEVGLSFGGGCRVHSVRMVAWGGWLESNPVQVRLLTSHEDFDDPCDAVLNQEKRFDLGPLKKAYQDAYGVGLPGETTLVLLLEDPMIAGPLGARVLEYRF